MVENILETRNLNGGKYDQLFRIAAVAAFGTVTLTIIQIVLGVIWPPPDFTPTAEAAKDILEMASTSPFLTFLKLDGIMVLDYVLLIIVYLALYASLKAYNQSLMSLGTVLTLIAITLYITSNPSVTMLVLAENASFPLKEGAGIISAAQTTLAYFQGTGFIVHYIIMGVAGIIISFVMLKSPIYTRSTAIAGLAQGVLMLVPVTFGMIGLIFALVSLIPFMIWFILIGLRLLKIASRT